MDKVVKLLNGHSGSFISLMEDYKRNRLYVRKVFNVERNVERLNALHEQNYFVPKVYDFRNNVLDMEYIHGLDMKTYLIHNNTKDLTDFLINTLNSFAQDSEWLDYTEVYNNKLNDLDSDLPFTKDELISRLPKFLPRSTYHGDFTLENIIYSDSKFCMIDPVTVEYNSYFFDIAKLRQDLECKWFLRNSDTHLDIKLQNIKNAIYEEFNECINDRVLILMLLRVLKHCKKGDDNYHFLMKEINRLWTL